MSQETENDTDPDLTPRAKARNESIDCLHTVEPLNLDLLQETQEDEDTDLTPRGEASNTGSIDWLHTSEPQNLDILQETQQDEDMDLTPQAQPSIPGNIHCLHTSQPLITALHGMSNLIHTRLSQEALDLCLVLLEAGVNPRALANIILHTLAVREISKED